MASKKSEKQFMLSENEFNQMAYDNTALMNPQYIDDIDYKNEIQPMNSQQTKSNQFINNADSDRYSCWSRFTHCIRSKLTSLMLTIIVAVAFLRQMDRCVDR